MKQKKQYYSSFDIKYCENIVKVNFVLNEENCKNLSKVFLQTNCNITF